MNRVTLDAGFTRRERRVGTWVAISLWVFSAVLVTAAIR